MTSDKTDKPNFNELPIGHKFLILMFISIIGVVLTCQVWYYEVIPYSENYQRITYSEYMTGIQDFGRYYAHYIPDYPEPGEEINLYFDLCNVENECSFCTNCTITAYTIDEKNNKRNLIKNQKQSEEKPIALPYHGKIIHVIVKDKDVDYKFKIPKPSFFQSCKIVLKEHPFFMIAAILSPIAFILSLIGAIISFWKDIPDICQKAKKELTIRIRNRTKSDLETLKKLFRKIYKKDQGK